MAWGSACWALLALARVAAASSLSVAGPIARVAFGACNDLERPQPMWPVIAAWQPQVWLWTGDVVYQDEKQGNFQWAPSPPRVMRAKLEAQRTHAAYAPFARNLTVLGIWDDHDMGSNNAGGDFVWKEESKAMYLDFLGEPADSPRRTQRGMYQAVTLGGADGRSAKLLLLDTRYFRASEAEGKRGGDMLGEEQWRWLEAELAASRADFHVVVSGVQVLPVAKPLHEKWAHFPHERARLLALFRRLRPKGLVLVSGDVHYAELLRMDLCVGDSGDEATPLFEFTSSGLTHTVGTMLPLGLGALVLNALMRDRLHVEEFYTDFNFGTLEFDWLATPPRMVVALRGRDGAEVMRREIEPDARVRSAECRRVFDDVHYAWYKVEFWPYPPFAYAIAIAAKTGLALLALATVLLAWRRRHPRAGVAPAPAAKRKGS